MAHRSVTGPHLYSLHLEPLQANLQDRPDAFQWYDEFDRDDEYFTGRDYSLVETVISPGSDILSAVRDQVCRVVEDFLPAIRREWDGDKSVLMEGVVAWLQALEIPDSVRVIERQDLPAISSHPLLPSQCFTSPLYTTLYGVLDVMEFDLKRAGLYELVNVLLGPVYTASHIGYLRLLAQATRLAGEGFAAAGSDRCSARYFYPIQSQIYLTSRDRCISCPHQRVAPRTGSSCLKVLSER